MNAAPQAAPCLLAAEPRAGSSPCGRSGTL